MAPPSEGSSAPDEGGGSGAKSGHSAPEPSAGSIGDSPQESAGRSSQRPPFDETARADANGQAAGSGDYDARLVALNMALNGESREATDRFIAENYEVEDRKRLLDEVFAAVEG